MQQQGLKKYTDKGQEQRNTKSSSLSLQELSAARKKQNAKHKHSLIIGCRKCSLGTFGVQKAVRKSNKEQKKKKKNKPTCANPTVAGQSHETKAKYRKVRQQQGGWTGRSPLNRAVGLGNKEQRQVSNLPLTPGDLTSLGSTKVRRHLLDLSACSVCGGWEENSHQHT